MARGVCVTKFLILLILCIRKFYEDGWIFVTRKGKSKEFIFIKLDSLHKSTLLLIWCNLHLSHIKKVVHDSTKQNHYNDMVKLKD